MKRGLAWFLTVSCLVGLVYLAWTRLEVDADITSVLPRGDPVVNDARYVLSEHPALERVYIDVHLARDDRTLLLESAKGLEERLEQSGLFRSVGLPRIADTLAQLYADLVDRLPTLFSAHQLNREVLPRLSQAFIKEHFVGLRDAMAGLEGIGGAELLARDPLSLRDLVMARLGLLRPSRQASLDGRVPISGDGRHALVMAVPMRPGADTAQAARVLRLVASVETELNRVAAKSDNRVRLILVGGMRAALDNERTIRRDTERALLIVSAGIVLLILLGFPRPLLGLLSFVPAMVGAAVSIGLYSLFNARISAVALGFGGALISITVDHGLTFLLFYSGGRRDAGRHAARQVWSVGLLAALTTVCAFLLLPLAGFPLLTEVGLIAGVGVGASFLFIHLVFPWLLPATGRRRTRGWLPLPRWLERVGHLPRKALWALVMAGVVLGLLARPRFAVDLHSMNAMTPETVAAEAHFKRVWGSMDHRVYVVLQSPKVELLLVDADRLAALLDQEEARGRIRGGFAPGQIFPGSMRAQENLVAWRAFWSEDRQRALNERIGLAAEPSGFAPEAFAPFLRQLSHPQPVVKPVPTELWPLFGIVRSHSRDHFLMLAPVDTVPGQHARAFVTEARGRGFRVLDMEQFPERLADLLARSFGLMLALVGTGVLLLLTILLFDWRLILASLAPLGFSAACTLGTLTLLGRPLDLAGIMLAIVVVGLGLDYGLYFVRAFQRAPAEGREIHGPVRTAVLLSGATTVVGFASLAVSEHPVLRSVGVTVALGLGFALLGALVLVPPLLRRLMRQPEREVTPVEAHSREHLRRVAKAYGNLPPYPRLFAWFKTRTDPMFPLLKRWLPPGGLLVDIGCGHGVPATWAVTLHPELRVVGMEPDAERARVASLALGDRAAVVRCLAPHIPVSSGRVDVVLMLDVVHHLDDESLGLTLARVLSLLGAHGKLVMRATVPEGLRARSEITCSDHPIPERAPRTPTLRRLEKLRLRSAGLMAHYRSADELCAALAEAGFAAPEVVPGEGRSEEVWFVAEVAGAHGGETP